MEPIERSTLVHIYETTIAHTDVGELLNVLVVPRSVWPDPRALGVEILLLELGGRIDLELHSTQEGLASDVLSTALSRLLSFSPRAQSLMDELAGAPIVPVEASPLTGESLLGLVGKAGAGLILGVVAGAHQPPLMLITGPVGLIVVGAASGISEGLREGLRRKVLHRLGVPSEAIPPATSFPPPGT